MKNAKLRIIVILSLCLFRFFIKGKATKKIGAPRKILIAQMAKMGDMVCTTPMFRAVKANYPKSKVYVLGNGINKELLDWNPDIDRYIIFKNNFFETARILREKNIDFACLTSPGFVGLALLYFAGIPLISAPEIKNGFSPYETKSYKLLRKFVISAPHYMGNYAPREYLKLLEPIHVFAEDTKKHLFFSSAGEQRVSDFFLRNNARPDFDFIVIIAPSAGNKIKLWGGNKFAKVADYLYRHYNAKIIIVGAKNDTEHINEMLCFLDKNTKVINVAEAFAIDELKALISKANLFISVDTGPLYIAEAFGVPTIDIVGPMDECEQPPAGEFNRVVKVKNRKKPELHIMNARVYDAKEARRQVEEITAGMVTDELNKLVDALKKRYA